MKKQLFDDLVTSIKQAGRIHRGEEKASRTFVFQPDDVRDIREKPAIPVRVHANDWRERLDSAELEQGRRHT